MKRSDLTKHAAVLLIVFIMILSVLAGSHKAYAEETETDLPDNGIPVVYINIDESQGTIEDMLSSDDHSAYCYGTVSIDVPKGFHYADFPDMPCESVNDLVMSIRGRGNSTWQKADKKAFKIKLDKKADLFGFGKNKHWVLLANALDETLLRDRITAWLGDQLGFEFTPRGVPVDLVMRGEQYGEQYLGSYYLSENVRVDTNRLEIDELTEEDTEEPAITGGYLIQHGLQVKPWSPDKFFTSRGVSWATHTPSFDVEADNLTGGSEETEPVLEESYAGTQLEDAYENPAQQKYIQNYVQMTEDTLFDGTKAYRDLFDLRSAALYWWVQEFSRNADSYGTGSYYVYKKRDINGVAGKLFTGLLWDFDFAWDNKPKTEGFEIRHTWLLPMFCDREEGGFLDELKKQWPAFRENIVEMIRDGGLIDQYYEETASSAAADSKIWRSNEPGFDYKTEVEELKTWITDRLAWVDANLDVLDNAVHRVTFLLDDEEYAVEFQVNGDTVRTDIEVPEKDGYVYIGWEDEDGEIVEDEIPVTRDMILRAKYLSDDEVSHGEDIAFRKNSDVILYIAQAPKYVIDYEVIPVDAVDRKIEWSTDDESFATVESDGIVSFNSPGEVTVYAKLKNGTVREFRLTITSEDIPVPESVYPLEETVYMTVGQVKPFTVDTVPSPAKINVYEYESDDESIVTVDEYGALTAVGPGQTTVRVHTTSYSDPDDMSFDTEITVIVTEEEPEPEPIVYTVAGEDNITWKKGTKESITVTVKRSEADETCFSHFKEVKIDDALLEIEKDYTAVSGSTVVTVNASALERLAAGEHSITVEFDDGTAEIKLTVSAGDPVPAPDTGDHGGTMWMVCFAASPILFFLLFAVKKKYVGANR